MKINKALFLAVIAAQTAKWAEQFAASTLLTEQEKRWKARYQACTCGCAKSERRAEIEAEAAKMGLTVHPAVFGDGLVNVVQGAAFVHTGNDNSHDYRIGAVCVYDRGASRHNLTVADSTAIHNNASPFPANLRPATLAEQAALWPKAEKIVGNAWGNAFEKPLTDDNLDYILSYL